MTLIEDLESRKKEKEREEKTMKGIEEYLDALFEGCEKIGREPKIIYDTFLMDCSERFSVSQYMAKKMIQEILSSRGDISFDGTTIRVPQQIRCACGACYSEVLRKCPKCKKARL